LKASDAVRSHFFFSSERVFINAKCVCTSHCFTLKGRKRGIRSPVLQDDIVSPYPNVVADYTQGFVNDFLDPSPLRSKRYEKDISIPKLYTTVHHRQKRRSKASKVH
jgi:hypothetical protein